jgi:riboflavin synthase
MFTGIITDLGEVLENDHGKLKISVEKEFSEKLDEGTSIAVNGVCLTAVEYDKESFSVDYMPETARKTTIRDMIKGDKINLELSATPQTFLAGHIVQGHVDGLGKVADIIPDENSRVIKIEVDESLTKYMVDKGSVAVNGISLTLIEVREDYFTVGIIPHTWEVTMLEEIKIGDKVNIEVDIMGKYIYKFINK